MHEMLIGKSLEKALNGRVKILPANNMVVMKLDGENKQFVMVTTSKGKLWDVREGPAISSFEEDYKLDFNQALNKLASEIVNFAKNDGIIFNLLVMPLRAVERSNIEGQGDILVRYIEGYMPVTDDIAYRYDVLISKEKNNA